MDLGKNIKELLEKYDMTQKKLAEELDLTPATLGNYIRNIREPDYNTLIRIADYFDVSIDFLLDHNKESKLTHEEEILLHLFRSLTAEQKEFYLEQGKIFMKQNNKKQSSRLDDENDNNIA